MKLKNLLIIIFVFISAVPLFIGLQYLNKQAGSYATNQIENHLSAMSLIAKKRILTAVERIKDNTALISSRTQMRISLEQWNQTHASEHQHKIGKIIHDARHGLTLLKTISIYDKQGKLVASTSVTPVANEIALEHAQNQRIYLTAEADDLLAVSQTPLELSHQTVGYIHITFFTDFIIDLIKDRTGLGVTGEWLIAVRDENGDALFAVPLKYDHQAAFNRRVAKERLDVPIIQALLGNERLMHSAPDYREQPVLASTRYLAELDWGLVAKVNMSEVNQLVTQNNTIIYIAEFIIITLAIIIGIVLALFIARPIEILSAHTAKVSGGNLEYPPKNGGWQEVQQLTEHFTYMITTLRNFNAQLQTKVDKRTKELNKANQRLALLATQDPLTGLSNRRKFDECLIREFKRAKRYQSPLAVVMIDIDHFKLVNDTYGHAAGDQVLKEIADHLQSAIRESDIIARIGGEEFCLLLPECKPKKSLALLERLRSDIANIEFVSDELRFSLTCSFGIAFMGQAITSKEMLLNQADIALYQAKEGGRNSVVQYKDSQSAG